MLLVISSTEVIAGEVLYSDVRRDGDHFYVQLKMQIQAPTDRVYQLLSDYDHLQNLSETIVNSRVIARQYPHTLVEVTSHGCVLFFCRTVRQVQLATELGHGYIKLIDDAQKSDFQYGRTLWHIAPAHGKTRVTLSADLQPRFWVPPVIGTALFKSKLLNESTNLINNLEKLAQHDS